MQREIKFRAKIKSSGDWIVGDLVRNMSFHPDRNKEDCVICQDNDYAIVDEGSVGQYTGLTDKKGVEGYHKDIVTSGEKLFTIEWQEEEARFLLLPAGNNTGYWRFMDMLNSMEIIGNIYENPELLNQK